MANYLPGPDPDDGKRPERRNDLSLKEAGKFDHESGQRAKLTIWGAYCKHVAQKRQDHA